MAVGAWVWGGCPPLMGCGEGLSPQYVFQFSNEDL